jgi:hypothetical protein
VCVRVCGCVSPCLLGVCEHWRCHASVSVPVSRGAPLCRVIALNCHCWSTPCVDAEMSAKPPLLIKYLAVGRCEPGSILASHSTEAASADSENVKAVRKIIERKDVVGRLQRAVGKLIHLQFDHENERLPDHLYVRTFWTDEEKESGALIVYFGSEWHPHARTHTHTHTHVPSCAVHCRLPARLVPPTIPDSPSRWLTLFVLLPAACAVLC